MLAGPVEVQRAVELLRGGGLVGFPTETVYGLGADALNEEAVRKVFALKGRPARNPLIVHVSGAAMARRLSGEWPEAAARLAGAFWPGPLSIVVPRAPSVPDVVTAGGGTVALRCPRHFVALSLLRRLARPLVGPSANPSGRVSPTRAGHVRESFPDLLVLDGGACSAGIESTVVKIERGGAVILRPGMVTPGEIEAVVGRVRFGEREAPGEALQSPGRLESHYAPRAPVVLASADEVERLAHEAGGKVVVLALSELAPTSGAVLVRMPRGPKEYAAAIYAALREADAASPVRIIIERPPTPEAQCPQGPERQALGSQAPASQHPSAQHAAGVEASVAPFGATDAALWIAILDRLTRAASGAGGT